MTASGERAGRPVVTALRRPPVRQATLVRASVQHTFATFVTTMRAWWPVQPLSAGKDRVRDITVEQRTGGRVYETWADGTEVDWGQVTAWEPPRRFAMTWNSTPVPTEVEFTFAALGPALTRVAVEHRGWEALTDEQLAQDCAAPGGYSSGAYTRGWAMILARLTEALAQGAAAGG
jgi:activator of Hsp90 ATPase-like protein